MKGKVKIIDLSVPLESGAVSEFFPPTIEYTSHEAGAESLESIFGVKKEDLAFSKGLGWAIETVHASTHAATHLDAPWHYGKTSEGKTAKTIDEVPLEWCYGDGVVLDMRHKLAGELIIVEDLEKAIKKIDYTIKPNDIVLIMTGADKYWGTHEYFFNHPGMGRESTLWLLEKGVKIIGIDSWGFDRPFSNMAADYARTKDGKVVWPAHFAGITKEYCHIEKLANLNKIPKPYGFKVAVFPLKIKGASASWVRPVAIIQQ
jgi:kynurenine formamidase